MKYKTMYAMHETRMWVKEILGAGLLATAIVASNPELSAKVRDKWESVKSKFKKKPKTIKFVVVDAEREDGT